MNVLIVIVAGVSAGWVAHKLYHALFIEKKGNEEQTSDKQIAEGSEEPIKAEILNNNSASSKETVTVAKKETTKKQARSKEKTAKKALKKQVKESKPKEESTSLKDKDVDDLSQLKGVGPKLAEALDEIGIYNFEQLSSPSIDMLLTRLRETGGRFSRPAITAVVERAQLAVKAR